MGLRFLGLLSVMVVSFSALAAPSVLVEFTNGNQIYGSQLTIFSDGTVTHGERSCCPPHTGMLAEPNLSPERLSDLETWVSQASSSQPLVQNGSATTDGSLSGSLLAYSGGDQVIIYEVDRGSAASPGSLNKVTANPSPAARTIKNLVEAYVKFPLQP